MYQEWKSPSFSIEQLIQLSTQFFKDHGYPTSVEVKGKGKTLVRARIDPIGETQTITVEHRGGRMRITFPPLSHATDGLARLSGLLLTGRAYAAEAKKQLILDGIEQQFWETLDKKLAEIAPVKPSTSHP